jgi:UDP-N-acetylglucosamine 1-carboxyvinyltransferase
LADNSYGMNLPIATASSPPAFAFDVYTSGSMAAEHVPVQGSKNCFNHVTAAAAAGRDLQLSIRNVPDISDRYTVGELVMRLGVGVSLPPGEVRTSGTPSVSEIDFALGKRLRVTICYAAALAANVGQATCPLPGGDAFTRRPIDVHLRVLEAAGATCSTSLSADTLSITFRRPPRPVRLSLATPFGPSMGASATALLVAAQATGVSLLRDLSLEPEVMTLLDLLRRIGVEIDFQERDCVKVSGAKGPLSGNFSAVVPPDRIEAGTYVFAGLLLHDKITLSGIQIADLPEGLLGALDRIGIQLSESRLNGDHTCIQASRASLNGTDVVTAAHPGFPTDLQPQLVAFLTQARGASRVTETVYSSRITHAAELAKLNLRVGISGNQQLIRGPQCAIGGQAEVRDIRCGAALIVAAAAARQRIRILDSAGHLRRGYSSLSEKCGRLGIVIQPTGAARGQ